MDINSVIYRIKIYTHTTDHILVKTNKAMLLNASGAEKDTNSETESNITNDVERLVYKSF